MTSACDIRVRGVVQGVGFRPFVFRLAQANTLAGWVLNDEEGVEIHLEGARPALDEFVRSLVVQRPRLPISTLSTFKPRNRQGSKNSPFETVA